MTFTTASETVQAGTLSVQFYLPDSASITQTVYIDSIGELEYEFEVPESETNPDAVGTKPGAIEVGLMQKARNRELVTAFDTMAVGDRFIATLSYTDPHGSLDGSMNFYYEKSMVSFDEDTFSLTVSLNPIPLIYITNDTGDYIDGSITSYIDGSYNSDLNAAPTIYLNTDSSTNNVRADEFVQDALQLITRKTTNSVYSDNLNGSTYQWYISYLNTKTISQQLGTIAALEGAVFGNFFTEGFYIPRNYDLTPVEINYDLVESLSTDSFYQSEYKSVKVIQGTTTSGGSVINQYGEKELVVSFTLGSMFKGEEHLAGKVRSVVNVGTNELRITGYQSYLAALGLEHRMKVSCTLIGFNDIKPFSRITFSSAAPSEYQSKTFAISSARYNFTELTLTLSMYEIDVT